VTENIHVYFVTKCVGTKTQMAFLRIFRATFKKFPLFPENENMQNCCFISACSCDEDCGLTLSCCFESMDRHHLVDKEQLTCTEASFPTEANYISPDGVWTINTCPVRKIRMFCKFVSIVVLGNCFSRGSGDIIKTENNQKQYFTYI